MKKNYFALIGLLLSLCFTSSATVPELIYDAGFETYPVGTISDNALDFATPKAYKMFRYMPADQGATVVKEIIDFGSEVTNHGWQCLKLTVSGTLTANYNGTVINYSDGVTLEAGKTYIVKYSVKTSATIQASTIRVANSDGGVNDVAKFWHAGAAVSSPIDTWRDISFEYSAAGTYNTLLAAGVSIQPIITPAQLSAAGGSISIYLDNFSIKEKDLSTSISATNNLNEDVYLSNKILYVNNSNAGSYQIYNIAGVMVDNGSITNASFSKVLDLSAGIYLVKVGTRLVKVSIK